MVDLPGDLESFYVMAMIYSDLEYAVV